MSKKSIATVWLDENMVSEINQEVKHNVQCSNKSDVIRAALVEYFQSRSMPKRPTTRAINVINL